MSTQTSSLADSEQRKRKVTTARLSEMKARGEKIAMLTAYDYSFARILDQAGLDVLLVGDSASNVIHGHETTVPITLNQMIDHAAAVVRGVERALVVVDMPFGSYQGNSTLALESAVRIMKESGAHCVKMEGGGFIVDSVQRILSAGIPVIGIGAGPHVDGQVLVTHDMLGINAEFSPRFLRLYARLFDVMKEASEKYVADVKSGGFPTKDESY